MLIRDKNLSPLEALPNDLLTEIMWRVGSQSREDIHNCMLTCKEFLQLPDVVGQILSIQGPNLTDATSKQKLVLLLLMREKSTVRVTIWDDQAVEFRRLYTLAARKVMVIICTCLNPKLFAGTLYLNSTGATKFYLDDTLNIIQEFMTKFGLHGACGTTAVDDSSSFNIEMETWNIS